MEERTDRESPSVARTPPRLVLIGTGHVFAIDDTVRDAIVALRPDRVFVELDRGRYGALIERKAGVTRPAAGNWVHRRLQAFQDGLAKEYGTEAGAEMLAAIEGAGLVGARVHLVDRHVELTLRRVLAQLTIRERIRALGMIAGSALGRLAPWRRSIEDEVDEYNRDPEGALEALGRQFPTVRRVLIDERDDHMATGMRMALAEGGFGVAVVGDGHVPGLLRILADMRPEAYRLPDVRAGRLPRPDPASTGSVSFSFEL